MTSWVVVNWGPTCEQTDSQMDMAENITFSQSTYAGGNDDCKNILRNLIKSLLFKRDRIHWYFV